MEEPDDLSSMESRLLAAFGEYSDKEKIQLMVATILLLLDDDQVKILIRLLQERVQ